MHIGGAGGHMRGSSNLDKPGMLMHSSAARQARHAAEAEAGIWLTKGGVPGGSIRVQGAGCRWPAPLQALPQGDDWARPGSNAQPQSCVPIP
jgi:hypothetical protein